MGVAALAARQANRSCRRLQRRTCRRPQHGQHLIALQLVLAIVGYIALCTVRLFTIFGVAIRSLYGSQPAVVQNLVSPIICACCVKIITR